MYLFFDVEAVAKPKKYSAPHTDSFSWPRMVQIAWLAFDEDKKLIDNQNFIIKPDGFEIPEDSGMLHGITMDVAREKGVPLEEVLEKFALAIRDAKHIVAHNMNFNEKMVAAEFFRKGIKHVLFESDLICIMQEATHYCKLPGKRGGYKWPSQKELYMKIFKKTPKGLHNAALDVRVTANCFFTLLKIEAIDID